MEERVGKRVAWLLAPDPAEVRRLAAGVEAFIARHGLPPALAFAFNLCFEELIANTLSHGAPDTPPCPIRVRLTLAATELRAEIVDRAAAFDPFADAPPPDLAGGVDERRVGGLGVHLVKHTMDRVAHRREGDHNVVTLAKSLASGSP